jgi:hypothetical protein
VELGDNLSSEMASAPRRTGKRNKRHFTKIKKITFLDPEFVN